MPVVLYLVVLKPVLSGILLERYVSLNSSACICFRFRMGTDYFYQSSSRLNLTAVLHAIC